MTSGNSDEESEGGLVKNPDSKDATALSASQRLSQQLTLGKARSLESKAWSLAPELFQGLVRGSRPVLMEVACQPNSRLAAQIQETAHNEQAAVRCSLWNACDLETNDGVRLVLQRLDLEKPVHCWISPPCGPFSTMQNANSRTEEQKQELQQKRAKAMRAYVGTCIVFHACVQRGIHVTIEMSEHCQAWRLPIFARLRDKYRLHEAVTKGCRVGLRGGPQEPLLQKGWRLLTTQERLASAMHLPCRCHKGYKHGRSEGRVLRESESYTKEYVRRAAEAIMCEHTQQSLQAECGLQTGSNLPDSFGEGAVCTCSEVSLPQRPRQCSKCCQDFRVPGEGIGGSVVGTSEGIEEGWQAWGKDEEALLSSHEADIMVTEVEAQRLLASSTYTHEACTNLLAQLPCQNTQRQRLLGNTGQGYLILGMYACGNKYGVTRITSRLPVTTKYLLSYLQHWSPEPFPATTVVVKQNNKCPVHRDVHNQVGTLNRIIGLGKYKQGRLWVQEDPNGTSQKRVAQVLPNGERAGGEYHEIRHKVLAFNPKAWHGPEEWSGERYTLTGYVSRGAKHLASGDREQLQSLGFQFVEILEEPGMEQQALALQNPSSSSSCKPESQKQRDERIKKQLYLLHAATGHGSVKTLVEALKRRQADPHVIELARHFECSVCKERGRVQSRHLSPLEALPPKWHTIAADIGHWQHPGTRESVQFMMIIDEGSRFRVGRVLSRGSKQQPNAATCLDYLREGWIQYFGTPRAIRLDPAGCFRSQAVQEFCDRHNIYHDNIPADGHWQIGVCEQAIQGVKGVMTKLAADNDQVTPEEALSQAVHVFNARDHVRGFSPIQHAFGRSPDTTGRLLEHHNQVPEELVIESATEEFEKSARLRAEAEKAHAQWHMEQRITRALNSRSKPVYDFRPGELVYFWRTQESGQGRRQPGTKHGKFLGPARILATETRREADGTLRPGSAVWCVRGRSLLKCCLEQLRHASEREELLEGLARDHGQEETPWTFTKVAEEIGGNQYQDISDEKPETTEWFRSQNVQEEAPPVRYRFRGKRAEPEPADEVMTEPEGPSQPSQPSRPRVHHAASFVDKSEKWTDQVPRDAWTKEPVRFWQDGHAAVEVEVEMPETRRTWEKAANNLQAFFAGALKRRAVEVSEKKLSPQELQQFKEAKAVEVKNFLAAEAFQTLPPHLRPSASQAIGMRWILTWKSKEDGTRRAKARAVLLGYQDPAYEHRATTAPVMTRQSRQLILQMATNRRWTIQKGDVSGAFLQGRQYPSDLYCIPCDEICRAMQLPPGTVTKLKRACYGLVDAPLEWYRTVHEYLLELGFQRIWSDACVWTWRKDGVLRGVISGHVDDFLFGGSDADSEWQAIIKQIQQRFKWGDWDSGKFTQCGVQVEQTEEGFLLSQRSYLEDTPEISLNSARRKTPKAPTTDWEKSKLRGVLGAISWHAQQVSPHLSAEVSLLLSEVNNSTVDTVIRTNQFLSHAKAKKDHQLKIHRFPEGTEMGAFAWVDAGSQNRPDGGSTLGVLIGLAPTSLLQGEVCPVSVMAWHSNRIDRVCRSPGAAETQAAISGEDLLYYLRYQWGELLHGVADAKDPDSTVRKVPGCVISDSRNVFDKLQTEVVTIKGAERKANIELLSLKEAQSRTQVEVRWVHSEAQLANSLTKAGGGKEIELFYRMQGRWRIVEDEQMRSARRRKTEGLEPLQQGGSDDSAFDCQIIGEMS